jgi:hypothetical protein
MCVKEGSSGAQLRDSAATVAGVIASLKCASDLSERDWQVSADMLCHRLFGRRMCKALAQFVLELSRVKKAFRAQRGRRAAWPRELLCTGFTADHDEVDPSDFLRKTAK